MQKVENFLLKNPYVRETAGSVTTTMLQSAFDINPEKYNKLRSYKYLHLLAGYPLKWERDADVFSYINAKLLNAVRKKNCYIIFDLAAEGYSPICDESPLFDMLYYNCERFDIDPSMIIYASSNLKDSSNIKKYATAYNKKPINIFSYNMFEKRVYDDTKHTPLKVLKSIKKQCNREHTDKFYSSLSRMNRMYRSIATYFLCQSEISKYGLISHNTYKNSNVDIHNILRLPHMHTVTLADFQKWAKTLPLTVDRSDFETNWAMNTPYDHIHNKTIFQIVNETMADDHNGSSLFYSEKTFRPIVCMQPFVIYGQPGANAHLKKLGYSTYEDWFDYTFDEEQDPVLRYKLLLAEITRVCKYLESCSHSERIAWRFKNESVLLNNYKHREVQATSIHEMYDFLDKLEANA